MRILCTCPGKFGDILWALATARAISEGFGQKVDFATSRAYKTILPLICTQPYIGKVIDLETWEVQDTAPMTPRVPPPCRMLEGYDRVFHLGYSRFPDEPLARFVHTQACQEASKIGGWGPAPLNLHRPWITVPGPAIQTQWRLVAAFSDEWFELKVGVRHLVAGQGFPCPTVAAPGSRWAKEAGAIFLGDWIDTARILAASRRVLCCLSAQWVLANALGIPTIVMEPSRMRWDSPGGWRDSIFWREHPKNTMVTGIDGLPTFDARAVVEVIRALGEEDDHAQR